MKAESFHKEASVSKHRRRRLIVWVCSHSMPALQVLPFCVALTFFVIIVFIIQTGNKNKTWKPELPEGRLLWVSALIGGGIGVICLFTLMPYLRKRVLAWEAKQNRQANVSRTIWKSLPFSSLYLAVLLSVQLA